MNLSSNHFLYDPASRDLRFFENPDRWTVTGHQAAEYLRNHVIASLEGDVPPILDLFEKKPKYKGKGFFAMVRAIFPYLTWAGKLFRSSGSEADRASVFLNYYTGQRYREYGKQLYEIYRDGLMHRHFPNVMVQGRRGPVFGWEITLNSSKHLKVKTHKIKCRDTKQLLPAVRIPVCPRQLYQDIRDALHAYAKDLEAGKLLKEFCQGFRRK